VFFPKYFYCDKSEDDEMSEGSGIRKIYRKPEIDRKLEDLYIGLNRRKVL
jgi:hypothetical protein